MNMKIHRIFKCGVFIVTLLSLLVSCSDNNEPVLLGSDDQLSFSSSGADNRFTVCALLGEASRRYRHPAARP